MTEHPAAPTPETECRTCQHLRHPDWCDETVITGSSAQEMCGCSPSEHPAAPTTKAGRAMWAAFNDPDPSWIDDGEEILRAIIAIEAEARAARPPIDVERSLTEIVAAYTDGDWQSFGRLIEDAAHALNLRPSGSVGEP